MNGLSWLRPIRLALFGAGTIAAISMTVFTAPDARLAWAIVALFCAGSFFDTIRTPFSTRLMDRQR